MYYDKHISIDIALKCNVAPEGIAHLEAYMHMQQCMHIAQICPGVE